MKIREDYYHIRILLFNSALYRIVPYIMVYLSILLRAIRARTAGHTHTTCPPGDLPSDSVILIPQSVLLMDDFVEEEEEQTRNRLLEMSRNSSKWFVQDPCGIACAVATYVFLIYGEIVVLLVLLPAFPTLGMAPIILLFTVLMILSIVSHVKAMLTNPVSQ